MSKAKFDRKRPTTYILSEATSLTEAIAKYLAHDRLVVSFNDLAKNGYHLRPGDYDPIDAEYESEFMEEIHQRRLREERKAFEENEYSFRKTQ